MSCDGGGNAMPLPETMVPPQLPYDGDMPAAIKAQDRAAVRVVPFLILELIISPV